MNGYLAALFKNNQLLEVYLEQRRSRSGKVQKANEPLFDTILNLSLKENEFKKDVMFVPVTLNYDRVIEGDIFPLDLVGEKVEQMSFFKIMKQFTSIRKELGKVFVRYAKPISLEAFTNTYLGKNQLSI